jgi:uracil-DNA glycosylase family 4
MDQNALLAALAWQAMIGADEAIGDEPVNRLREVAVLPALVPAPPAGTPPPPLALNAQQSPASSFFAEPAAKTIMPRKATLPVASTIDLAAAATTLDELREAIRAFDGIELKQTATNLVFADGVPTAKVMVIGEAPGSDEDRLGKPFVGMSGRLLDKMLGFAGFSRESNLYITNVINWRPPGNRKPTPLEIHLSLPFLHRHIELIDPDFILCPGGISAVALTGSAEGITKLRGRWHDVTLPGGKTYKLLPTFHPAFLLRSPGQKKQVWQDLLKLKEAVKA